MTNNELRAILTKQQAMFRTRVGILRHAIPGVTVTLSDEALGILNSLGHTVVVPDSDATLLSTIHMEIDSMESRTLEAITAALVDIKTGRYIPEDDNEAKILPQWISEWDLNGDSRFDAHQ